MATPWCWFFFCGNRHRSIKGSSDLLLLHLQETDDESQATNVTAPDVIFDLKTAAIHPPHHLHHPLIISACVARKVILFSQLQKWQNDFEEEFSSVVVFLERFQMTRRRGRGWISPDLRFFDFHHHHHKTGLEKKTVLSRSTVSVSGANMITHLVANHARQCLT